MQTPVNITPYMVDIWGQHTSLIADIFNGIGIFGVVCAVLMLFFIPSAVADDEEFAIGWRYGREYKMNLGRRIGIWLGYCFFAGVGIWVLFVVAGGLTIAWIIGRLLVKIHLGV